MSGLSVIAAALRYAKANAGHKVLLAGHTDSSGETDYNRKLSKTWVMRHETPCSQPVPVVLTPLDPADVPLLAHLRRAGGAREPNWANLLKTPTALDGDTLRRLSEQARRALVPYLIVHQTVHGPEPLAAFPVEFLSSFERSPWASEAGVLSYELRWARRASDLPEQKNRLLARWSGLAFRLREIEAGAGLLTTLRREYGPEGKGR